ncbi:hypothetical protein CALCODRAFT_485750 [Calocera cornea HHB12733]|uniref:Zinc finger GRF-type domain-containing protein n=1 Tax=Calocera cornea HHB12733 TaxID=1353952 RepID=A0A165E721_9BASI|nr:hypothetical protein CALCODRAFT_485750 [Calocera cornea HHB12733]
MAPSSFKPTRFTLNLRSRSGSQGQTDGAEEGPEDGQEDGQPAGGDEQDTQPPSPPAPHRSLPSGHPPAEHGAPILYPTPAYTYSLRPRTSRPTSANSQATGRSPHLPMNARGRADSNSMRDGDGQRPASRADTPRPRSTVAPQRSAANPSALPTPGTTPAAPSAPHQGSSWKFTLQEDASTTTGTESAMAPSQPARRPASTPLTSMANPPRRRQEGQWRFTMQGDALSTIEAESTVQLQPMAGQPAGQPASPGLLTNATHAPDSGPLPHTRHNVDVVGDGSVRMVTFEEWDELTRARPAGPWTLDWWPEGLPYTPPQQWATRHFWSGELHLDWQNPSPEDPWIPCMHCKKAHWFISTQKNPGAKFFKCPFNRHPEDCRTFSYEGPLRADGKIKLGTVVFPPGIEPDRYPPANLIVRPPEHVDPRIAYIRDMRNRENQRRYNELQERFRQARLEGDRIRSEHAARQASQPASQSRDPDIGPEHYAPGESPLPVPFSSSAAQHVEPPSPTPVIAPRAPRPPPRALRRTNTAAFRRQYEEVMGAPMPVDTSQDLVPSAGPPSLPPAQHAQDNETRLPSADTPRRIDKGKGKVVEKRPAEEEPDGAPPAQRQRTESSGSVPPTTPRGPRSWHGSHTWPIGMAPDPEYVRRDLAALASLPGPQTRLTMLHLAAAILADPNVLPDGSRAAVEGALNHEIDEEGRRLREEESRREYDEWAKQNHRAPPRE